MSEIELKPCPFCGSTMAKCENCFHNKVCINGANYRNAGECRQYIDESLIVELPCKVGDTVYIPTKTRILVGEITRWTINEFVKTARAFIGDDMRYTDIDYNLFGKLIFLTREDAEKALKERKHNDL